MQLFTNDGNRNRDADDECLAHGASFAEQIQRATCDDIFAPLRPHRRQPRVPVLRVSGLMGIGRWLAGSTGVAIVAAAGLAAHSAYERRVTEQECRLGGEYAVCMKACELGVADEGGCLSAASAPLEGGQAASRKRKLSTLERGCELHSAKACVELGEMYDPADPQAQDDAHAAFDRACALHSEKGCKRLASWMLRSAPKQALGAGLRACLLAGSGRETTDCTRRWQTLETLALALRPRCQSGDARACDDLGDALVGFSVGAAHDAYLRACELRGLREGPQECANDEFRPGAHISPYPIPRQFQACVWGRFDRGLAKLGEEVPDRWRQLFAPLPPTPDETSGPHGIVHLAALQVRSGSVRPGLEDAVKSLLPLVRRCYDHARAREQVPEAIGVALTVDRLGDIDRAYPAELATELGGCAAGVFQRARFPAGPDVLRATVRLHLEPPHDARLPMDPDRASGTGQR